MTHFGISGYIYNDWVGNSHPIGMPKREWLTVTGVTFFANNHWRGQAVSTTRQQQVIPD